MFKPARMTRVLMGGHKDRMEAVIDALHKERLLHLEDFEDETGTTGIGAPLEHGDEASEHLLLSRGLLKALDAEGTPAKQYKGEPGKLLADARGAIDPALHEVSDAHSEIARLDGEVSALSRFAAIDMDLSALDQLTSVRGFLGTVRSSPSLSVDHEMMVAGDAVAVVVAAADAGAAETALNAVGFQPAQLPPGLEGTPKEALAAKTAEHQAALARLQAAQGRVVALRETWAAKLAAVERHLTAVVDRTQAPLRFAVTETTFHAEGWIPVNKANRVQNALAAAVGDAVYFEQLGDAPADPHHAEAKDEAPVKLENRGLAKPYEFMLNLLGRPRYWELDPTKLMLIFFPLFFGLMVGDVAVGILIMLMGLYLKKNHIFGIGGKSVGRALFMGGFVAVIAGGVIFGEALGIHFTVSDEALEDGEHSWEEIIYGKEAVLAGHGFPHEGFIYKHVSHHGDGHHGNVTDGHGNGGEGHADPGAADGHGNATDGNQTMHPMAESTEDHGGGGITALLKPHGTTHLSVDGHFNLGYYSKVHDIQALLIWSVIIAFFHLNLAFILGFRNVLIHHGAALAIQEKLSWITLQLGFGLSIWSLFEAPVWALPLGIGVIVTSIALLWVGVQKALGAPGFVAILEVLGFAGNILSYTRLAAIGASKAGMALAFMAIGFEVLGGGSIHSIVGWIVYSLGMVVITALAMLSGGLQSLRLQFVESFQKFYTGGGRPYVPFGRRAP